MNKFLAISGIAAAAILTAIILTGGEAFADRVDVWLSSSVDVYKVELNQLADGGCSVQAYANILKSDGGSTSEGSRTVEVAGANRTECLNIINTRAPVLFRADKGL